MVKKYRAKEMGILFFLTLASLAISSTASSISFLAKELVELGTGIVNTWQQSVVLALVFVCSLVWFLAVKYIGQNMIIDYKKELNGSIFRGLLQKQDFVSMRADQGKAVTIIVDDTAKVCGFLEDTLPSILETFIVSFVMGVTTFFVNKVIFAVVLMLSFLSSLAMFFSKQIDAIERENYDKKDQINREIIDVFRFIGVASSIRNTWLVLKDLETLVKQQNGLEYRKQSLSIVFGAISRMCSIGREAFVILYGMVHAGFDAGMVVAMLNITSFFNELVSVSGDFVLKYAQIRYPLERINSILEENPEGNGWERQPRSLAGIDEIQVHGLSYSYDGKNGISDVSFRASKCYVNVLKGVVGSGKSTVGKIVSGVIEGYRGEVLADGNPLDSKNLRSNVAYVDQESVISIGTIAENITAFDTDVDRDKLWRVVRECGLQEWVDVLDNGLDTPLCSEGLNLSGGQKQRIAIARAMYKDAPAVVLDEPTSALDDNNCELIWSLLCEQKDARIILVITHDSRILGKKDAQMNIVTMQDGKIVHDVNY